MIAVVIIDFIAVLIFFILIEIFIFKTSETDGRSAETAFSGMVVHHIQDYRNSVTVKGLHHGFEFINGVERI